MIKAQALAGFIAECSFNEEKGSRDTSKGRDKAENHQEEESQTNHEYRWSLYVDGATCSTRSEAGVILEELYDFVISYAVKFNFSVSNNMAKYEALINRMQLTFKMGVDDLKVLYHSQLVVN